MSGFLWYGKSNSFSRFGRPRALSAALNSSGVGSTCLGGGASFYIGMIRDSRGPADTPTSDFNGLASASAASVIGAKVMA
jgi:hypothetical protein